MDIKKMMRWAMALAVALPLSAAFTACGDDDGDGDGDSTADTASIMAAIDNKSFKWDDDSYAEGSNNLCEYNHYVTFSATSENSGTVGYRLDYRETDLEDGSVDRGSITDRGTFTISDGKIKVSVSALNGYDIDWFKVKGNSLVANNGATFDSYGSSSEVETTDRPADEYELEYNSLISTIICLFSDYETQLSAGDPAASSTREMIKSLQAEARNVRLEAAAQGIKIQQSPYETKSV